MLATPQAGLRIRILTPLEGTGAAEKLQLLRVVGNQQFLDTDPPGAVTES